MRKELLVGKPGVPDCGSIWQLDEEASYMLSA